MNFSFEEEFKNADFGDSRLDKRLVTVMNNVLESPNSIIQKSQGTFAEMMGAYRLLGNDKVTVDKILQPHIEATKARMADHEMALVLHDTTSVCYSSLLSTEGLGSIGMGPFGAGSKGIFLHTSMATTVYGTPLGILKQEMWSRGMGHEKGSERTRWLSGVESSTANTQVVNVADREADRIEFYAIAYRSGVDFVVRAKEVLRKSTKAAGLALTCEVKGSGSGCKVEFWVRSVPKQSPGNMQKHRSRQKRKVEAEIFFKRIKLRPISSERIDPPPSEEEHWVNAVYVSEINPPARDAVNWLLFTSLPIDDLEQAKKVIDIYKVRWQIEIFHKILKSTCKVENAQLEHADRLKKLITILSVVAWRLLTLVNAQREMPDHPCTEVLSLDEWQALYVFVKKSRQFPDKPPTLREVTLWIAKLGGYLARKNDGEPGALTLAEGWIKLMHYTEMFVAMRDVYKG